MSPYPPVIIDTNIFFSALLNQNSRFATIIQRLDYRFFICEYVVVELFKYKERIVQYSRMLEEELLLLYYNLLRKLAKPGLQRLKPPPARGNRLKPVGMPKIRRA